MLCNKCKSELTQDMFQSGICFNCGYKISKTKLEQEKQKVEENNTKLKELQEHQLFEKIEYQKAIDSVFMTTTPYVEGYKVVKHFGLVFGDTIFKPSFTNRVSASLDDFSDIVSFGDKELSGSVRLLMDAREYAIKKIKSEAIKKGANAIIGIDSEGVFSSEFCHVTIVGTAVKIEEIQSI